MPGVSYSLAFDGGVLHYKTECTLLRFCKSAVPRYNLFGRLSSLLNVAKKVSATALSSGLAVAEKDCFPHTVGIDLLGFWRDIGSHGRYGRSGFEVVLDLDTLP